MFPVEKMCQALEVSRAGYYEWKKQRLSKRKQENQAILEIMTKSYDECQGMCGLDKLWELVHRMLLQP